MTLDGQFDYIKLKALINKLLDIHSQQSRPVQLLI